MTDHPRQRQADALARAQAWTLVSHQCMYHEWDSDEPRLTQENLLRMLETPAPDGHSAIGLILAALGEILGELIGHQEAIRLIGQRVPSRSGEHMAVTCAELIAATFGGDGEAAAANAVAATEEGEFWGLIADEIKAEESVRDANPDDFV